MDLKRYLFLLTGAFGLLRFGFAAGPGSWLTESGSPYTFENAGKTSFVFPSADYKEWSIFNASSTASEREREYTVSQADDEEGPGMLRFNEGLMADERAWLSLGISKTDGTTPEPIEIVPTANGTLRVDSFSAKVRFEYSDVPPEVGLDTLGKEDVCHLLKMYPSYSASLPTSGLLPSYVAAKLGICVLSDGHFYISRVTGLSGTATAEDLAFGFCKSKYSYADLGGGTVIIRIEFRSYLGRDATVPHLETVRAYRIFAAKADGTGEVCLSEGLGYRWQMTKDSDYTFDFSSFEEDAECSWLFPLDNAYAIVAAQTGANLDIRGLHTVQQLAFNATDGGFYSAWIATNRKVEDKVSLTGYQVGEFASYLEAPGAAFDTYATWASANSVTLSEYLDTDSDTSGAAFNAFLLNTSPEALAGTTPALSVTGIVTDKDANTVTVTVRGPEGCDITDLPAARLCIRRAATLGEVATAEAQYYDVSPTAQQTLTVVLPYADEDGTEYPFLKACLVPIAQ